jgi:hypothetical protein
MTGAIYRVAGLAVALAVLWTMYGEAHKPITSKYTFNEHVFPIFQKRCAPCHVDGGAAPMSLMAYADARPWAESIRAELVAAHMPPGQAETGAGSFANARDLPPHDLDIVLTWATGGTPQGPPSPDQPGPAVPPEWPIGTPDLTIPFPSDVTLPRGMLETTVEFPLPSASLEGRAIRAVDLRPGLPAVVRRAIIYIRGRQPGPPERPSPEDVIALWLPDRRVSGHSGVAFAVPEGAELMARVTYRKTWKYENSEVTDRSTVGVYFDDSHPTRPILAVRAPETATMAEDVQAVAVRPRVDGPTADIALTAVMPDGSRLSLIRFTADRQWPQRFWYDQPIALPRGTRLESSGAGVVLDVTESR